MSRSLEAYTVVGLGEVLWDVFPSGRQLGGAPANFAYHAQALGSNSTIVSCLGTDDLAREARQKLEEAGLDTSFIASDSEHPTGRVSVELDTHGVPSYTIHENVAWDFIPYSDPLATLADTCAAVCFGSLCQRSATSRRTIHRFLSNTRSQCIRIFDINLRQQYFNADTIRQSLELATVLKLNDEELSVLAELLDLKGDETSLLLKILETFHLKLIALTRGAAGSRLITTSEHSDHPGYRVKIKDTVGAGDSFTAALAVGLLRDGELEKIHDYANRLASYVCGYRGAMPELTSELMQEAV